MVFAVWVLAFNDNGLQWLLSKGVRGRVANWKWVEKNRALFIFEF